MSLEPAGFVLAVAVWTVLAVPVFIIALLGWDWFGRVGGQPIGARMAAHWGWFLMELPALVTLPAIYFAANQRQPVSDLLVVLWMAHYAHRALIWPWLVARRGSPAPVITFAAGFGFNMVNGLLFGWFLVGVADYPDGWFGDVRFVVGVTAMLLGAALNIWADYRLAWLRRRQPGRYVLPEGGAFRFISCPNLAGEMLEWAGFSLMSWSLPGLAFAVWTAANLVPRALWRHRWYQERFPEYPKNRRAIIPGLW